MSSATDLDTTAEPNRITIRDVRRGFVLRSIFFALIVALIATAAFGYLGFRSRTLEHRVASVHSSVTYGQFTRRGLSTPLHIEVETDGGFDGDLTIAINDDYLSRFSIRNLSPQPEQESSEDGVITWTFQQPEANRFSFDVDTTVDPSATPGWVDANLAIVINDRLADGFSYRTWIWP